MTYDRFDPATDDPERRINQEPHAVKVNQRDLVKAVDTTKYGEQPTPHGTGREIAPLVIADIEQRMKIGEKTYGERLKAHNGRDSLVDAYEEALDLAIYLRQAIEEHRNTTPLLDRVRSELDKLVGGKFSDSLYPPTNPALLDERGHVDYAKVRDAVYSIIGDIPATLEKIYGSADHRGAIKTEAVASEESEDGAVL